LPTSNKKIIPIIIVAVIAIGAFAFVNSDPTQDQASEMEQTKPSEKSEVSQEIKMSESESTSTDKLESNSNQINEIEKDNVSSEKIGPTLEIKETSKQESINKLESNQSPAKLRAVIIDQLNDEIPNYNFQANATRMLEDAGYTVDLYTTKDITVEFYKKLPSMNYNFILIRTHGGEGNPDEEYPTILFTGEKYATEKYTLDQLSGQVGRGFPFYDVDLNELREKYGDPYEQAYFTVGSKLVKDGMEGTFPDSTIIIGGCQTARSNDLMMSFIRRGADNVLGWDATIAANDNDKVITSLLEDVLVNKVTLYNATKKINKELGPDFKYPSLLKLFSNFA